MLPAQKTVVAINQASTTNGATATGNIDTLGFGFARVDVHMTTSNDATNNPSVLKISESDDTVVTNFADITEAVGDGTGGFTIPAAVTAGSWTTAFDIDLRGRKRYLKVSVTPLTTQNICAVAHLSRGKSSPADATAAGVNALVAVG